MSKAQDYQWSPNARRYGLHRTDPEKVNKYFRRLYEEDDLNPARIVRDAQSKRNPLHAADWHWDDPDRAIERWRLHVASNALSGIRQVYAAKVDGHTTSEPLQVWVDREKSAVRGPRTELRPVDEILADQVERAAYLARLLTEIRRLERQYGVLIATTDGIGARWHDLRRAVETELEGAPEDRPEA